MFKVFFFKDKHGNEPVREWLAELDKAAETSKEHRVLLNKVNEYIYVLTEMGTWAGKPYVKHIEGDLWEMRPRNNRVFFFTVKDESIVLLHSFVKKTRKTPRREIERALKNMKQAIERSEDYE